MPNWCDNSIAFYSNDVGGTVLLEALHADIQKYADSKDSWVGNWLESNRINPASVPCRGSFISCELYSDHVIVAIESAWAPLDELYEEIAKKYDLNYVYIAEESGCEVYINTDTTGRFFSTRFILNYFELDYLELDSEMLLTYGERLKELSEETRYYDSFDEVLDDFKEFDFIANSIEDLNLFLEKFNLKIYEYSSE